MSTVTQIARDALQSIVQRIERLEEEIGTLNEDKSEIYKEAKGNGYDVKVLREVIRIRRKDAAEHAEHEALVDIYRRTLGMLPSQAVDHAVERDAGTPVATRARTSPPPSIRQPDNDDDLAIPDYLRREKAGAA